MSAILSETANPYRLKFLGMIFLRLQMVLAYKDRGLNPGKLVISKSPLIFVRPSVRATVRLSFVIKLVTTSPPKPLNGLSSNF